MLKVTDNDSDSESHAWAANSPSCVPYIQSTYSLKTQRAYLSSKGVDTPQFHRKLREGKLLPFTPWTQYQSVGTVSSGSYTAGQNSYTCKPRFWSDGIFLQTECRDKWYVSQETLQAIADSYDLRPLVQGAAANISGRFDALTFLAELHKTVHLFKDAVHNVLTLVDNGQLAKLWLEGRYGWRILYYDMRNIQQLLQKQVKRTRQKMRVGYTDSYVHSGEIVSTSGTGSSYYPYNDSVTVSCRGSVLADIATNTIELNPFITTWELMTYSFVFDWFVNVGNAIEAASFLAWNSQYVAAGGVQVSYIRQFTGAYTSPAPGCYRTANFESLSTNTLTIRTPMTVTPRPLLSSNLNAFKVLDLVALLFRKSKL